MDTWQPPRERFKYRFLASVVTGQAHCLDNAAMESFFGTLKSEFFYLESFESVEQLASGIEDYIAYYNQDRISLRLNGLSPVQFRIQALNQ